MKTLKISKLIKILEAYRKELGDIPVFHQKDPEGNEFGTIDLRSIVRYRYKSRNSYVYISI